MTDIKPPRVPASRKRGRPSTLTPTRLGSVASSILQGDSIKAACHASLVPEPTYKSWMQRGEAAIVQARVDLEEDDVEGMIWTWVEDLGGFKTCDPSQPYWSAKPPTWWPRPLHDRWANVVFVIVIAYARARAEQVYRQVVTKAAAGSAGQPPDWKAAQFMLTHSFGWRDATRVELTGADGGAIQVIDGETEALAALRALAERRKIIDAEVVDG